MAGKMLKGRGGLKSLSTEVDQVEPAVTTFALVDAVVMKAAILVEKLRSLEGALKLEEEPEVDTKALDEALENPAEVEEEEEAYDSKPPASGMYVEFHKKRGQFFKVKGTEDWDFEEAAKHAGVAGKTGFGVNYPAFDLYINGTKEASDADPGEELESVGDTGEPKDVSGSTGLNGKLENAVRNLEFTDITLQDVADYLGVEI